MFQGLTFDRFKFTDRFIDLTPEMFEVAYNIVVTQFSGVKELWGLLPPSEADAKRELCFNYLIGWELAVLYPTNAVNVSGVGGIPLEYKKAGPISIGYRSLVRQTCGGSLDMLTTNEFGIAALSMIQTAPEVYMLFV